MTSGKLPRVTSNITLRLNDFRDQELCGISQEAGSRPSFPYLSKYYHAQGRLRGKMALIFKKLRGINQ